jgi:hypothetical protein
MRLVLVAVALVGCNDSTDIAGTYIGNATYTRSDGTTGAGSAVVVVTDGYNNDVDVAVGPACPLFAAVIKQIDITDHTNDGRFVLTSERFGSGASCVLPDGAIALDTGFLVVDAGLTMTLDLGGPVVTGAGSGSDYVVYNFAGAVQ